jgi:predicted DNA binding CopG/RHH family protein
MKVLKLNEEEKQILGSYERDEWKSLENAKAESKRYQEYARSTFQKDRRVNIRVSTKDLEGIQKKAIEEGMPYQTLISSILHKYISGRLVEKST